MEETMHDQPQPIPVTILTGFLGAGKTTLLNRILYGDHGLRVAVLVNDFGAINIDAELVVGVDDGMVSLSNGCICCSLRDDLLDAALQVLHQPNPPEYFVIEASGVSDPLSIALTFVVSPARERFRLDSIVAVVDAEQAREQQGYADLLVQQIGAADVVVLNKIDLVDEQQRKQLRDWIRTIVARARVLEARYGEVPLPLVLGVGRYRFPLEAATNSHDHEHHDHDHKHDHDHHHHGEAFRTTSVVIHEPLSLRALQTTLKTLPPAVFRAKGVLQLADLPNKRAVLQLVGRRVEIVPGAPWGDEPPCSKIVMIGQPNGWNEHDLEQRFRNCVEGNRGLRQAIGNAWQWVRS